MAPLAQSAARSATTSSYAQFQRGLADVIDCSAFPDRFGVVSERPRLPTLTCWTEGVLDLTPLRSAKVLEFSTRTDGRPHTRPARTGASQGAAAVVTRVRVSFTRTAAAVLALVNQIAREFAAAAPPGKLPAPGESRKARSGEPYRLRSLVTQRLPSSHWMR